MSYPTYTLFAGLESPTLPELDANLALVAALAAVPCTVVGSNVLALTPQVNPPGVAAYNDYLLVQGVAAANNTGPTTATVGSLGAVNVYKDTPSGPVVLAGGEIVANNWLALVYDRTLNSSAGGWHLVTNPLGLGVFLALAGGTLTGPLVGTGLTMSSLAVLTGGVKIGTGETLSLILSTTASISFGAINPQSAADQTVTLTGVATNDLIMLGLPAAPSVGLVFDGFVSGANVVTVRASNITAGTITAAGASYRVGAMKVSP